MRWIYSPFLIISLQKRIVIIVAGGSGTRMNPDIPKQFLPLSGLPVLMHTINVFRKFDPDIKIVIALPRDYISFWNTLCIKYNFEAKLDLATGGETRVRSVKNALMLAEDSDFIAIHDGVRPLVSEETIRKAFEDAAIFGNAIPVIPLNESVRKSEKGKNTPVPRNSLYIVQTPQVFKTALIQKAYSSIKNDNFTDDATVLETTGEKIHLFDGSRENIKITYPDDLIIAEALLRSLPGK
jgi:2-C-methyl-D-erythritol 4-phosphate cytidylyltransferase